MNAVRWFSIADGYAGSSDKSEGILLVLCLRNEIFPARQNFPHRADYAGNVLDTVDDRIFIAENEIAVLSHNFNNERFLTQVAHFVQMFQADSNDPFQSRLGDIQNSRIL